MSDAATVATRLEEARTALHEIATGKLSSYTTATQETYTRHDLDRMRAYVRHLEEELVEAQALEGADGDGYGFVPLTVRGPG